MPARGETTPAAGSASDSRPFVDLGGAWRWTQLVGRAVTASAIASLLTLVANTILLRTLPLEEAGRFALLIALLQVVALLGNLGQPSLYLRLYSRQPPGHFDWSPDLRITAALSAGAATVGGLGFGLVYDLTISQAMFLIAAGTLVASLASVAFILNSQRHYSWSALLLRLPYSLMILPAALTLVPNFARLDLMILAQLACAAVAGALGVGLLGHLVERGSNRVSRGERLGGLVFLVVIIAGIVPVQGLVAVTGALVPSATLAGFAAFSLLLRPFDLLRGVLQQVLTTELVRGRKVRLIQMVGGLWGVSAVIGIAALAAVPTLGRWAYAGRYEEALGLVPWLTLAGVFTLTESLPRSYVLGRASDATLNRFVAAQVVIAALGIATAIGLTLRQGILGAAVAGAMIYGVRNLVAYGFLWAEERATLRTGPQAESSSR